MKIIVLPCKLEAIESALCQDVLFRFEDLMVPARILHASCTITELEEWLVADDVCAAVKVRMVAEICAAKEATGKTFDQISKEIGLTNAFTAQLFLNQARSSSAGCNFVLRVTPITQLMAAAQTLHRPKHNIALQAAI